MNDTDMRETEEKLQRYYQLRHIRTTLENLIRLAESKEIKEIKVELVENGIGWLHKSPELSAAIVAQLKIELARTIAEMEAM